MKNYYSTYKISRLVSDDLWSKIFRFNKNVRLFKQMGVSYYYSRNLRAPIKLKAFHLIRSHYKDYSYRKKFIKRFMDRKKFKFFYGYLNNRTFKLAYAKSKGPISYSPGTYFMARFELLFHIVLFRSSFFVDSVTSFQIVLHNFVFLNGYRVSVYSHCKNIGEFISFSKFFYFSAQIKERIKKKVYIFPPLSVLVSEFLPIFIFVKYYKYPRDAKKLFNAAYENLFNSF